MTIDTNQKTLVFLTDEPLTVGIKVYELVEDGKDNYVLLSKSGKYRVVSKQVFYVHGTREEALARMTEMVTKEQARLASETLRLNELLLGESKIKG